MTDVRTLTWVLVGLASGLLPGGMHAQMLRQAVVQQVDLIVEGNRLVASNIRFSRFDEYRLNAQERIRDTQVGKAVIVVVTNQNFIAYGAVAGWRSIARVPREQVERISAADFGALVVTTRRMVNFNGETGTWGERQRRAGL